MKDRLKALEDSIQADSSNAEIIEIAGRWYAAIWQSKDFEQALAIRREADPILEAQPDLVKNPPHCRKTIYIDWLWFCFYTDDDVRKYYNQQAVRCRAAGNFHSFQRKRGHE